MTKATDLKTIFFFNELALKNWATNMHFNPVPILQGLFLRGGWGYAPPPRLYIDSDPPAFIGLSPFEPKKELKVYNACKCSQIICSTSQ